jgi:hypothetical protein
MVFKDGSFDSNIMPNSKKIEGRLDQQEFITNGLRTASTGNRNYEDSGSAIVSVSRH